MDSNTSNNTNYSKDKFLKNSLLDEESDEKIDKESKVDTLQPNKYISYYQLNDEGLRQYGTLKKKQLLSTLKWSFLGTTMGFISSFIIEIGFKRMDTVRKDYFKAGFLTFCVMGFSFIGYKISLTQFKKEQQELCKLYGKPI
jgi:hypothetical protein